MIPDGFKASHSYFHLWFGGLILQCCLLFHYQLSEALGSAGRCGCLLLNSPTYLFFSVLKLDCIWVLLCLYGTLSGLLVIFPAASVT